MTQRVEIPFGFFAKNVFCDYNNNTITYDIEEKFYDGALLVSKYNNKHYVIYKKDCETNLTQFYSYWNNCDLSDYGWSKNGYKVASKDEVEEFRKYLKSKKLMWDSVNKRMIKYDYENNPSLPYEAYPAFIFDQNRPININQEIQKNEHITMDKKRRVFVKWLDSHHLAGWEDLEGFESGESEIESYGVIVYESNKVVSIAANYCAGSDYAPEQANGIMTIPKVAILEMKDI